LRLFEHSTGVKPDLNYQNIPNTVMREFINSLIELLKYCKTDLEN